MSENKTLLFLHGVSPKGAEEPEQRRKWRESLWSQLSKLGYEDFDSIQIVAPEYADLLSSDEKDKNVPMPPTVKPPKGKQDILAAKLRYNERLSALEMKLGHNLEKQGFPFAEPIGYAGVNLPPLTQAKAYISDDDVRAQVLQRILDALPESGNIFIIGHSLGSVIAADLISRLPEELTIDGLITIGSPLGHPYFSNRRLTSDLETPPLNLGWWVNFWGARDAVAAARGVSAKFPWVLDQKVDTGLTNPHASSLYLADETIAKTVGVTLLGSTNKSVVLGSTSVDVRFDDSEWPLIAGLRYLYLIEVYLGEEKKPGDKLQRFSQARKFVQHKVVTEMIGNRKKHEKPVPSALYEMVIELGTSVGSSAPEPPTPTPIDKEVALQVLPLLFTENLLHPFEIDIDKDIRVKAARDLTAGLHHTGKLGKQILDDLDLVNAKLSGNKRSSFRKYGIAGVGFAAVVVATGGLALAAAPGLAGGAMITSALASFGPGGMIGGLATSGSLIAAGSGTLGLSLSNPESPTAEVEGILLFPLVEATLRKNEGYEVSNKVWHDVVEAEGNLRREYQHLSVISESDAPAVVSLKNKLDLIQRALDYLTELGIGPESNAPEYDNPKAVGNFRPKFLTRGESQ